VRLARRYRWLLPALLLAALLLVGVGPSLQLAWIALHSSFGLALDLALIGGLLFLVAALMAPFEALGWWAGWFGDDPAPRRSGELLSGEGPGPGPGVSPGSRPEIERWVVYLDGIGQASDRALPEGEDFLRRLAAALPERIAILRGIVPYSVLNLPMTEGRWLAGFWRWVDRLRLRNPGSLLGLIINLRNLTVVAVSADRRYGPVFNRGMATVIGDSLLAGGYPAGSGTPVTLLGFSGGGQIALGALPHLRRSLAAPVEVISLAGVFAGNNEVLEASHLFHLVGDRDPVERLGPVAFPGRWRLLALSPWNRARRRGKVSLLSLGPVGHELPGGLFDAEARLPDGRSHLEQTVERVAALLRGLAPEQRPQPAALSNYARYRTNPWHWPDLARDSGQLPGTGLRPRQGWIGRLLLPAPERRHAGGREGRFVVDLEVFAAPPGWRYLVGRVLPLEWHDPALAPACLDVRFSDQARRSVASGHVHPLRLEAWRAVTPLESLAGARPHDDQLVCLPAPVQVLEGDGDTPRLRITAEPLQTTGVALALVRFLEPLDAASPEPELWRARCFDPRLRRFEGPELRLRLPLPRANGEGLRQAASAGLAETALNAEGWYASGVPDGGGGFVVQALLPRALLRFAPQQRIVGRREGWRYLKRLMWRAPRQGQVHNTLLQPEAGAAPWCEGERLLLVHVYGGIGGQLREEALRNGPCVGHFAFGTARLVREPLADELSLTLDYRQVYAHNPEGIIAGSQDCWRYLADRQWGWLGTRPVADVLVRFPPFTGSYTLAGEELSPLRGLERQLALMTARYRLGDGSGACFVGPANNCAQDSNQALFAAIAALLARLEGADPALLAAWRREQPEQAERLGRLLRFEQDLRRRLLPCGSLRPDWLHQSAVLGASPAERPLSELLHAAGSWRTALPRLAADTVLRVFLEHGAELLVLRSDQPGGVQPAIEPVAPITLG